MTTYMAKKEYQDHQWIIIDATDKVLGRLASTVAKRLRGKHKPEFTPHADTGDFIVIINADKVRVTGNKETNKIYYRHSEYPGGLKQESLDKLRARKPEKIIEEAVKGMLPKGPLGRRLFTKMKVYAGNEHPHAAQQPKAIEVE